VQILTLEATQFESNGVLKVFKSLLTRAATNGGSYAATWQQQLANGGMWSAKSAPNLVLGLPALPSAPDVDLFRGRKSPPFSLDHKHHL
jgi:hypothetical protein